MSQQSGQQQQVQDEVNIQEAYATDAVTTADNATAEQATGVTPATPEQAEQLATNAVINADAMTAQQSSGGPVVFEPGGSESLSPEAAEQQATQAVAATNYTD
ncbi:hypothetical protein [uncultured Shewanella sp.]|uniref:hypothetical protein n=1 Tax=uncultured Shewanella sp. TaxID=173975 RepID=UPI00260B58D4|nr:hypothetical protein [uncultured Shewanella sp.]